MEAILLNCLPPAVIVGLAHPYRQHQCFRGLWRSIGRDSGAILSKKGHQCASCSIRPWEMSFLTPFSNIISPTWGPHMHGDPTWGPHMHGDPTWGPHMHGDPTWGPHMGTPHAWGPHMGTPHAWGPHMGTPHAWGPHMLLKVSK